MAQSEAEILRILSISTEKGRAYFNYVERYDRVFGQTQEEGEGDATQDYRND